MTLSFAITLLAIMFSMLAVTSGILVVGDGTSWQFKRRDILKGRGDALVYSWITASTMFSLWHLGMLVQWELTGGPETLGHSANIVWMALHTMMGLLFTGAHMAVHLMHKILPNSTLAETYLWQVDPENSVIANIKETVFGTRVEKRD